jgi:hypothetical protein
MTAFEYMEHTYYVKTQKIIRKHINKKDGNFTVYLNQQKQNNIGLNLSR